MNPHTAAYDHGHQAYVRGVSRHANPYTEDERLEWWDGWDDAEEEEAEGYLYDRESEDY